VSKAANWTAESVAQLDQEDPLAKFRELFVIADPEICYLDGNSLGRLPKATIDRVNSFLTDEWGKELVDGWSHWIDQAQTAGDLLAKTALGAGPGQTLVCDTTSVNFYQLCVAAIKANPGRKKIIIDSANFPTDRYIVQGIAKQFNLELITLNSDGMGGPGAVEIASEYEEIALAALEPHLTDDVALLTLQAVNYRSGVKQDIKAITDLARKKGIYVVWDCSHAIGSVELNFEQNGVDLAVGCTYKYGNSGPGSPAWLYVRKSLQEKLQVPIQGWFAQDKQFEMGAFFEPTNQIRGFQIASPSIIGIRAVEVAFQMIGEASIEKINQKEVIPDYREPGAIRLGISPLPTSYSEVFEGFKRLKELVESGDYKNVSESSSRVT